MNPKIVIYWDFESKHNMQKSKNVSMLDFQVFISIFNELKAINS